MLREEIISNFACYMERERHTLGLTQAQLAEKLGMSLSGYKKMIAGETAKIDLFHACRMYELTGNPYLEFNENPSEQIQIFSSLQKLNSSQLRFINGVIKFELAFLQEPEPNPPEDYINLLTPTGDLEDGMIWDSVNIEKINASYYRKRFGSDMHCALLITSNHFHPVYNMDDILLISFAPPRDGDTGLFVNKEKGRAYLRRFRQTNLFLLEPLNNYGIPFTINPKDKKDMDKWIFWGRILSKMRH